MVAALYEAGQSVLGVQLFSSLCTQALVFCSAYFEKQMRYSMHSKLDLGV